MELRPYIKALSKGRRGPIERNRALSASSPSAPSSSRRGFSASRDRVMRPFA